ncbi:Alpha/Beta hydrolase protein [Hygrophoropsis aurantiaca]|uniref:Alpha/Beta hydrolase protein n=1 Tax=Hygrophoropsis aurantiaca TaxID=72124 RepID=A0ACB8AMM6_9AGAM|nr:Alpha/Beta hydrolase protein [Hygrophoropsis aurantiaca]
MSLQAQSFRQDPIPRLPMSTLSPPQKSPTPVIRWLTSWTEESRQNAHSRNLSSSSARSFTSSAGSGSPSDRSPSSSVPPSPALSALNEALNDGMPALPPPARLPPSFYASRSLSRPPPLLNNLTRSTMPTASISSHSTIFGESHFDSVADTDSTIAPTRISPTHSPPTRSSVDTLRSLHDRGMHTTATPQISSSSSLSRWWFQSDSKENVDALLNEEDRADTIQQSHDKLRKKYRAPKNPIVFCHGLLGFDSVTIGPSIAPVQVTHWRGIKEVLEANGAEVLMTRVPATSSPVDRAKVLEQRISEVYPGRKVHLVGHSMGGLDCRYLTTHLTDRKFEVLSITTIATPHRGSAFADHFIATIGKERMPSVISLLDLLPNGGGDGKAFECLTIDSMRAFNEETPDVDGVRYFSWGATYEPGLIDTWKWSHSVLLEKEGPNDGLVSIESSKWGTYLGTLSGVNHLDLVGWINTARYKWAEIRGKEIKFKPATFYLGIADYLAWEVEGQGKEEQGQGGGQGSTDIHRSDSEGSDVQRKEMEKSLVDGRATPPRTESTTPTLDSASTPEPSGVPSPSPRLQYTRL